MSLVYTATFTVTTTSVDIKRASTGDSEGDNVIPADVRVAKITLIPTPTDGTFPDYYVKGIHSASEWTLVPKEAPTFTIENVIGLTPILAVKSASGSITMNLFVNGET